MLTKSEIIELRARAIHSESPSYNFMKWEDAPDLHKRTVLDMAKATIEADEKAKVLMLVEEGENPEPDDVVKLKSSAGAILHVLYRETFRMARTWIIEKIIQRANTPVYQTRKEK